MKRLFIIFFCFFLCWSAERTLYAITPAQNGNIRFVWNKGKRYLRFTDIARFYGLKAKITGDECLLISTAKNNFPAVRFTRTKRIGSVNGTAVTFFYTPYESADHIFYISESDFNLILQPLLRPKTIPGKKIRRVLIDPGHGGKDKGAPGTNSRWEKEAALSMAYSVRKILIENGYEVHLTRKGDSYPSLEDRVAMINNIKPDIYVSIHCNASVARNITGIETYAATPYGAPSSSESVSRFAKTDSNKFDKHNIRLAYDIQKELIKATKAVDRGVKHARFYVIKNAACPAVLVETGFISNAAECKKIFNRTEQNKRSAAIADGIMKYAGNVAVKK